MKGVDLLVIACPVHLVDCDENWFLRSPELFGDFLIVRAEPHLSVDNENHRIGLFNGDLSLPFHELGKGDAPRKVDPPSID